jgi:hypothetical protein
MTAGVGAQWGVPVDPCQNPGNSLSQFAREGNGRCDRGSVCWGELLNRSASVALSSRQCQADELGNFESVPAKPGKKTLIALPLGDVP